MYICITIHRPAHCKAVKFLFLNSVISVAISEVLWYCVLLQREVKRRMAKENTARVITIEATAQPRTLELDIYSNAPSFPRRFNAELLSFPKCIYSSL